MTDYICNICEKEFKRKENLSYHIKNMVCEDKKFACKYCSVGFLSKSTMYRHIRKYCKIKKQDDIKKEDIFEQLLCAHASNKKKIDMLKKENYVLKKKVNKLVKEKTTTNVITNINRGTVNNIILVGYGKEDLSRIDRNDVIKALHNGFNSSVKLTETLHFNPKYPEYHNVYISNMKDKYAMTYDGNDWNLTIKENLINKIYDDKKNYIEDNLDDFVDSLSASRKKALDRWLETDDDDEKISKIKNEIKLLLYNKRNLVEPNKNKFIRSVA